MNFAPKYKMIQNLIFGILLLKYYFGHTTFYIRLHIPVDIIRIFLNFRFSSRKSQQNMFLFDLGENFLRNGAVPFLDAQELHS